MISGAHFLYVEKDQSGAKLGVELGANMSTNKVALIALF